MRRLFEAIGQWGQPKQEFELQLAPDETLIDWTRAQMWRSRYGTGWAKLGLTDKRIIVRYYPGSGPGLLGGEQQQEFEVALADVREVHMERLTWNPGRIVLELRDGRLRGFKLHGRRGEMKGVPQHWLALLQEHIKG